MKDDALFGMGLSDEYGILSGDGQRSASASNEALQVLDDGLEESSPVVVVVILLVLLLTLPTLLGSLLDLLGLLFLMLPSQV
mgnify:CR=1 FL=1